MARVCFREHGELAKSVGNSGGISYMNVLAPSLRSCDDEEDKLTFATHAIVHFSFGYDESDLEKHYKTWNDLEPSGGRCRIILIVSTGGRSSLINTKHDKWYHQSEKSDITYVLYARNQERILCGETETARQVLRSFYKMTSDEANAVYEDRLEDCPEALRSLFDPSTITTDTLGSLSILCQGFLAVHTNPKGAPEGVLKSEDLKDVHSALEKMKWQMFCQDSDSKKMLVSELLDESDDGSIRRNDLRTQVGKIEYWGPILTAMRVQNKNHVNPIQSILSKEWNELIGKAEFEPIKTILEKIHDSNVSDLSPGIVARAFIQLANRMEST